MDPPIFWLLQCYFGNRIKTLTINCDFVHGFKHFNFFLYKLFKYLFSLYKLTSVNKILQTQIVNKFFPLKIKRIPNFCKNP